MCCGLSHSKLCLIKVTFLSVDYKGDTIRIKYSFGESNGSVLGTLEVSRKAHVQLKKKLISFVVASKEGLLGVSFLTFLILLKHLRI